MASLPTYHPVPTDEKSAVDFYRDEENVDVSKIHPASVGSPTAAYIPQIIESTKKPLSKWKKALLALAVVWFTFTVFGHIGRHGHGHKHGVSQWRGQAGKDGFTPCGGDGFGRSQEDEMTVVPTVYGTALALEDNQQTANATFSIPLSRRKTFNLNFKGAEGNVIISKSEVTPQDDERSAQIIVESTYEGDVEGVEMRSGEWADELVVSSNEMNNHKIYLILPSSETRVRSSLFISSSKSLNFEIDPSAQGITFRDLKLHSESGDINVPSLVGSKVELETTTGAVGGVYNVSKALILKTVTGNISAAVHVLPPWDGPSRRPPPPHGGDKHKPKHDDDKHRPKHHDDDDDEEEEHHHKHHKKSKSKHHKKRSHHHHKKDEHSKQKKRSWFSSLFSSHPPPPPPPPGPPPPEPAFIGATSITGSVNLTILSQGSYTSSEIRASSTSNNVTIQHAENFRGFYDISTSIGQYNVSIPEKYKDHHILTTGVTETGGFEHGLVGFKRPKGEEPPKKKLPPGGDERVKREWDDEVYEDEAFEGEYPPPPPGPPKGEHPPPPPPPHGPPKGEHPPPPPHGPPGGELPPPPPPHGPPGGEHPPPPPPPPGPPKGDHPPPPPPGGDHRPPPPHGPPGGPPRGPHLPPPPPGHSRVFAHADIGNVQIVL
ncbi:hypothetical protein I302_103309 [Kwoniella bestiolae CBS 10118]|uniref:Adhesin domain-containing protein n=1 Tax=Kwoniella bestiolae CBS 10118 TaxID=1296100 RepID=A0AAJ8K5Q4_9TREE